MATVLSTSTSAHEETPTSCVPRTRKRSQTLDWPKSRPPCWPESLREPARRAKGAGALHERVDEYDRPTAGLLHSDGRIGHARSCLPVTSPYCIGGACSFCRPKRPRLCPTAGQRGPGFSTNRALGKIPRSGDRHADPSPPPACSRPGAGVLALRCGCYRLAEGRREPPYPRRLTLSSDSPRAAARREGGPSSVTSATRGCRPALALRAGLWHRLSAAHNRGG